MEKNVSKRQQLDQRVAGSWEYIRWRRRLWGMGLLTAGLFGGYLYRVLRREDQPVASSSSFPPLPPPPPPSSSWYADVPATLRNLWRTITSHLGLPPTAKQKDKKQD
ncbi:hypothetical protein QOT17_005594 [Balamuthia mandrillaris]